jgi:F0F1-type ATP synthase delta subunit
MKYSTQNYAKALAETIVDGGAKEDVIMRNFLALVRKNGDESHLPAIIESAARLVRSENGIRKVTISSARPFGKAQEKMLEHFMKPGDIVERTVEPSLVAGVKIIVNDEDQFDGSLKRKLDTIFHI